MKNMLVWGIFLAFASCTEKIDVQPKQSETTPRINFLARLLAPTPNAGDTLFAQVYVKQLDFPAPGEKYRLVITLPSTLDGAVFYSGITYRSGDWIEVSYAQLQDNSTLLKLLPYQAKAGGYSISLTLTDRSDQAKTASLAITIP